MHLPIFWQIFIVLAGLAVLLDAAPKPQDGGDEDFGQPQPYNFDFTTTDDDGSTNSRSEQGDEAGVITGRYEIRLTNGLFRIVEYTADDSGFNAVVTSNEPGVGVDAPANVQWNYEQTPDGIYDDRGPNAFFRRRK